LQTAIANQKDPNKTLLQFVKGLPLCQSALDCENLFKKSMGWE
jgi:hypothetical protein